MTAELMFDFDSIAESVLDPRAEWLNTVRRLVQTVPLGREFQLCQLLDEQGIAEPNGSRYWNGGCMHALAVEGLVRQHGFARSLRPGSRGSALAVWVRCAP